MTELTKGANAPLEASQIELAVVGTQPGAVDLMVLQLTAAGKVRSDEDFVFYNQPASPEGAVRLDGERIAAQLDGVPADIERLAVCVAMDDGAPGSLATAPSLAVTVTAGGQQVEARGSGFTSERAAILVEVYRRNGTWKVRNVSAGWDGGLAALASEHGVSVEEPAAGDSAGTGSAPTSNGSASGGSSPSTNPAAARGGSQDPQQPSSSPQQSSSGSSADAGAQGFTSQGSPAQPAPNQGHSQPTYGNDMPATTPSASPSAGPPGTTSGGYDPSQAFAPTAPSGYDPSQSFGGAHGGYDPSAAFGATTNQGGYNPSQAYGAGATSGYEPSTAYGTSNQGGAGSPGSYGGQGQAAPAGYSSASPSSGAGGSHGLQPPPTTPQESQQQTHSMPTQAMPTQAPSGPSAHQAPSMPPTQLPSSGIASGSQPVASSSGTSSGSVDLGKQTGAISLKKGQRVSIEKAPLIVARIEWPAATDYDVYALIRYADGHDETVAMFGTREHPQFTQTSSDGAVRHSGDVGRAQAPGQGGGGGLFGRRKEQATGVPMGSETIEIRLNSNIVAVVPVVYSAQSNGTGSFRRYQVSMSIDNGQGTTVRVDAVNANADDTIFTCVPGIVVNQPDGVIVDSLELYSAPRSEQRPVIGPNLVVQMDAGERNLYK